MIIYQKTHKFHPVQRRKREYKVGNGVVVKQCHENVGAGNIDKIVWIFCKASTR